MLPRLRTRVGRYQQEILSIRGVNYTDSFTDGDLSESLNLSTRRWPYLATRDGRAEISQYSGATAMTAWEKLVVVKGGRLYYDGADVGYIGGGAKQFAVVNTKLVIWPDKKYLDLQSLTIQPLGASVTAAGAVFTESALTIAGSSGHFKAGDTVTISGASIAANNKDAYIKSVSGNTMTFAEGAFKAGTSTTAVTAARRIPDMDFICESGNRLWGCSNAARSVYASALGDPANFYTYQGLSTDSYALAIGSEGAFTGCCKMSAGVLFWKERSLHKLLGNYPAEYALYTYSVEGLKAGCHKSLAVINETLYYVGVGGVYAYSGGTPQKISPGFDGRHFAGAVAGTDGQRYYLSVSEGQASHLFTYDLEKDIWLREDSTKCVDFARLGSVLCFLTAGGKVYETRGGDDGGIEWEAAFKPFYETAAGRKKYARLALRLELPKGSYLQAQLRSGGAWRTVGQWTGDREDVVSAALPIRRGDKMELRLCGKGPCAVLEMLREFNLGSYR